MRKKVNYIISFVMLLILSFIFTSCELPYFDFSNTFKNRGVNLDNFLLIDNKMSLNKIKYGLKVNPQETTYGDLITFSFFDNDIDIDLVLDAQNNLCSKSYTASNESLTKSTYGEYNKLRQGMSLQEACDTLGSEGTLTKQVYIDSNYDEKIGTTYLWAIDNQFDSSIKTIECSFDSENKIYKANYSGTIYDTQNENVDPEFLSSGYKKLADIPLGSTIDDAESVLGIKAELCCMGNNNHDLSSSFYKFKARDINYNTFDIDILTDDKGKITKKALYFGENFKFDTTANNLSAYEDAIKKGMSYDEVKNIMGGDGLLYLSETKPQLDNDFAQPPLLMQFVRTISDPSIMCNNLTGYEGDYYSYIENYDWYRSNFQVDVKFVDGKVSSFSNSHVFNNNFYDNEFYSNNGKGTIAESMQIDDTIRQKALSLTSNCKTDRDKAYVIYYFVKNHVTYDNSIFSSSNSPATYPEGSIPGAEFAYYNGIGVCFDYSCLFGAMMLANGIYIRIMDNSDNENGSHMWNQYYDGESNAWIPVDCTWGLFDFIENDVDSHHGPNVMIEYSNFN